QQVAQGQPAGGLLQGHNDTRGPARWECGRSGWWGGRFTPGGGQARPAGLSWIYPALTRPVKHIRWFCEGPMRILLVADIHANWPALQAVASEPHDVCVCLGDLVDYALEPAPVVEWVRQNARYTVRGNHDHCAAQNVTTNGKVGFRYLTTVTRALTRALLGPEDLRYLGALPVSRTVTLDGLRYLFVHASPRDPLDEYAPPDAEFWARQLQNLDLHLVAAAHTHPPYTLRLARTP